MVDRVVSDPVFYQTSYYQYRSLNRIYVLEVERQRGASTGKLLVRVNDLAQRKLSESYGIDFTPSCWPNRKPDSCKSVLTWIKDIASQHKQVDSYLQSDEQYLKEALDENSHKKSLETALAEMLNNENGLCLTEIKVLFSEAKKNSTQTVREKIDEIRSRLWVTKTVYPTFYEDYGQLESLLRQIGEDKIADLIPVRIASHLLTLLPGSYPPELFENLKKINFPQFFLVRFKWYLMTEQFGTAQEDLKNVPPEAFSNLNLFNFCRALLFKLQTEESYPSDKLESLKNLTLEILKKCTESQTEVSQYRRHLVLTSCLFSNKIEEGLSLEKSTLTDTLVELELGLEDPAKLLQDFLDLQQDMPSEERDEAERIMARFNPSSIQLESHTNKESLKADDNHDVNWLYSIISRGSHENYTHICSCRSAQQVYRLWVTILSKDDQVEKGGASLEQSYAYFVEADCVSSRLTFLDPSNCETITIEFKQRLDLVEKTVQEFHTSEPMRAAKVLARLYSTLLATVKSETYQRHWGKYADFCIQKIEEYKKGLSPTERALMVALIALKGDHANELQRMKTDLEAAIKESRKAIETQLSESRGVFEEELRRIKQVQTVYNSSILACLRMDGECMIQIRMDERNKVLQLPLMERICYWALPEADRTEADSLSLAERVYFVHMSQSDRKKFVDLKPKELKELFFKIRFLEFDNFDFNATISSSGLASQTSTEIPDSLNIANEYNSFQDTRQQAANLAFKLQNHEGKKEFLILEEEEIKCVQKLKDKDWPYFWYTLRREEREELFIVAGIKSTYTIFNFKVNDKRWELFWGCSLFVREKIWQLGDREKRMNNFWKASQEDRDRLLTQWKREEKTEPEKQAQVVGKGGQAYSSTRSLTYPRESESSV